MRKIFITHCSAKKDDSLKNIDYGIPPDRLYTATPTVRFMNACKKLDVDWAIFSDEYGIWFPDEKHIWYEKDPNTLNEDEFNKLVEDFEKKLANYDEIYFYHNPGRFHRLYRRLLETVENKDRIRLISHLNQIN